MRFETTCPNYTCGVRASRMACFKSHDTKRKVYGAFVYPSLSKDGARVQVPRVSNVTINAFDRCDTYQSEKPAPCDPMANRRVLELSLLQTLPPTDFTVWVKRGDVRVLAAIVRKTGNNIFFRHVTKRVGLGTLHIVQGYTKKLPEKIMRRIVGARDTDTVYMLTVRECIRYRQRQNREGIRESAPHDRRPQTPNQKGRKPTHKSDFVATSHMWYRK